MLNTYEPEIQPTIRLDSFHLSRLDFNLNEQAWQVQEFKDPQFKVTFTHLTNSDKENYFGILFSLFIKNEDESLDFNFDFIGHFEVKGLTIDPLTLETNSFFRFSAPAIIFPYIRSFVSTFMMNSGFKPIILPSLNFTDSKLVDRDE